MLRIVPRITNPEADRFNMSSRFGTLQQWLDWQESLHWTSIDLGLGRIREVAQNLQLLDPPFTVITVAGTNGKGSTIALLESMLLAEGYTTGAYTSPYLYRYNERIKLTGKEATDAQICEAFQVIDNARGDISLTYFEFATLAAIWVFKQQKIQVALLEVGMGGRLDAVNLWDSDVAVITSIGIDHVKWLGDNREDIAREKAGIMRVGHPVISGDLDPPYSISEQARRVGAILLQAGEYFFWETGKAGWQLCCGETRWIDLPLPALKGAIQINNAAVAVTVLQALQDVFPVTEKAIHAGLQHVVLPGRLECIQHEPEVILDVAHNAHAAQQLAAWLADHPVRGNTYALFSMLDDKDIAVVAKIMDIVVDGWFVAGLGDIRGLEADKLVKEMQLEPERLSRIKAFETLDLAWESCKKQAKKADRIIVFGSFLVLSEFKVIF